MSRQRHLEFCALMDPANITPRGAMRKGVACTCAQKRKDMATARAERMRGASSAHIELGESLGNGNYVRGIARSDY